MLAPRHEGGEVHSARSTNNPQAQVIHDERDNPGSREQVPVENHAILRLPDRPQDHKQTRVQRRGVHVGEASGKAIQERRDIRIRR